MKNVGGKKPDRDGMLGICQYIIRTGTSKKVLHISRPLACCHMK